MTPRLIFFRVIKELTGRFAHYLKTGDDLMIPGDIESAIYNAVRTTGLDYPTYLTNT
jgi:hypothetical protein